MQRGFRDTPEESEAPARRAPDGDAAAVAPDPFFLALLQDVEAAVTEGSAETSSTPLSVPAADGTARPSPSPSPARRERPRFSFD